MGEVFVADPVITSFFAGGVTNLGIDTGLDTPFDFPVYFTLRDVLLHGKPMNTLAATLGQDHLYPHPERLVPFLGNHDTMRFLSESGATPDSLRLAFGLIATLRGMPETYSGDEIAMLGGDDPDNRRDFPGGFPGDTSNAFTAAGRTPDQQAMFTWASQLFQLRAGHPALKTGAEQDIFADDSAMVYLRAADITRGCRTGDANERLMIAMSKAGQPRTVTITETNTALADCTNATPIFPDTAPAASISNGAVSVNLPPNSFAIYAVSATQ